MSDSKQAEAESKKAEQEEIEKEIEARKIPESLKDTFKDIREEAKSWRLKAREYEKKLQDIEAKEQTKKEEKMKEEGKLKELLAEKEKVLKEKEDQRQATLIGYEIRFIAKEEGMKDLDGLKMLTDEELKSVVVEGSEVKNAKEVISALKERKPYLFGENVTTVSVDASRPSTGQVQTIKNITREQIRDPEFYEKHREEILKASSLGSIKK